MSDSMIPTNADAPAANSPEVRFVAMQPQWLRRTLIAILITGAVFVLGRWMLNSLGQFLFILFLAWLGAIAIEPVVSLLSRKGMRRGFATGLTLLGMFLLAAVFAALFGQLFFSQLAALVRAVPELIDSTVTWVNDRFNLDLNPNEVLDSLGISPGDIASYAGNIAGGLLGIITSTIGLVFQFFTMLLFLFYFSAEMPRIKRWVGALLPPRRQEAFVAGWGVSVEKAGGFVVSRLGLALVSTLFHAVVFRIIDLPYWLPLAIWVGVVSQFIPTVGTYLAIALPTLIALLDGSPIDAVVVVIAGTAYQQIENYFISPKLSQKTMEIHPAVAFGSVIVGANLFGPIGALIAIPVAAIILSIFDAYQDRYDLVPELAALDPGEKEALSARKGSRQEGATEGG